MIDGKISESLIAGVKFASDLTEATNKMNAVFGDSAKIIEEFAETSARSFGIAESDAKSYAATLGQILKVSGLTAKASAEMSVELLKLAADMASFNDISIDEAKDFVYIPSSTTRFNKPGDFSSKSPSTVDNNSLFSALHNRQLPFLPRAASLLFTDAPP